MVICCECSHFYSIFIQFKRRQSNFDDKILLKCIIGQHQKFCRHLQVLHNKAILCTYWIKVKINNYLLWWKLTDSFKYFDLNWVKLDIYHMKKNFKKFLVAQGCQENPLKMSKTPYFQGGLLASLGDPKFFKIFFIW